MTKLSYGSNGDSVRQLQQALNGKGYNLDVDGGFGAKTEAAVRDYQTKNNLAIDGVAGDETWGSLNAVAPTAQQTPAYTPEPIKVDLKDYTYDPSTDEAYQAAVKKMTETASKAPTYAGTYDKAMQDIYEKIMNRKDFSYDLSQDMLYNQYKDQYVTQGKQAMQDTMGQAAALTGGYDSTYAQSAGQQQYDAYLQKLNAVIPELYQQARANYDAEGNRLQNMMSDTGTMQDKEYSRYADAVNEWRNQLTYDTGRADQAYSNGSNNFYNGHQLADNESDRLYSRRKDAYSNLVQLIGTTGYAPSTDELKAAGMSSQEASQWKSYYDQQMAAAAAAAAAKYSSGSGSSGKKVISSQGNSANPYTGATDNGGMNDSNFTAYMRSIAATASSGNDQAIANRVDAIWGSLSEKQRATLKKVLKNAGYSME